MTPSLFSPLKLGAVTLAHRVVMAPLTRMRAGPGNVPTAMNARYYAQRATPGGLLISEATPVCPEAHGHPDVPGIHTEAQVEGWRAAVRAVHDRGGADVHAALAHRPHLALQLPARRPFGAGTVGHPRRRRRHDRGLEAGAV